MSFLEDYKMTPEQSLATAIRIAAEAHEHQTDKGNKPYILHPLRCMMRLRTEDLELMAIAVLHDVIEDCESVTMYSLENLGFSDRVLDALDLLTHDKEQDYDAYVNMIGQNADARRVKIEDLRDNSDITRLKGIRDKDFERMQKYHKSFLYLMKLEKAVADE